MSECVCPRESDTNDSQETRQTHFQPRSFARGALITFGCVHVSFESALTFSTLYFYAVLLFEMSAAGGRSSMQTRKKKIWTRCVAVALVFSSFTLKSKPPLTLTFPAVSISHLKWFSTLNFHLVKKEVLISFVTIDSWSEQQDCVIIVLSGWAWTVNTISHQVFLCTLSPWIMSRPWRGCDVNDAQNIWPWSSVWLGGVGLACFSRAHNSIGDYIPLDHFLLTHFSPVSPISDH